MCHYLHSNRHLTPQREKGRVCHSCALTEGAKRSKRTTLTIFPTRIFLYVYDIFYFMKNAKWLVILERRRKTSFQNSAKKEKKRL